MQSVSYAKLIDPIVHIGFASSSSMVQYEDVDRLISWTDPSISITAGLTANVDTTNAFDKKMFIDHLATEHVMSVYRIVVC